MSRRRGGLYIGPWTLRIGLGVVGLGVAALIAHESPDLRRYMKFESM